MNKPHYQNTMYACFVGYIVQAIVNNFVPLLFVTFQTSYSIPLSQITILITINFAIQLLIDLLSAKFVDKIGYRTSVIIAHACSAAGLILLTILPEVFPSAFAGIVVSVAIYAVGGGLIEVLISPIVEACPTDNKEKAMSLLHSFYCWGRGSSFNCVFCSVRNRKLEDTCADMGGCSRYKRTVFHKSSDVLPY